MPLGAYRCHLLTYWLQWTATVRWCYKCFGTRHCSCYHWIIVHATAVRAISTDIIRQTIVQHCRTSDLELTALPPAVLNCDSLSTFKSRLKTHLFSTAFC